MIGGKVHHLVAGAPDLEAVGSAGAGVRTGDQGPAIELPVLHQGRAAVAIDDTFPAGTEDFAALPGWLGEDQGRGVGLRRDDEAHRGEAGRRLAVAEAVGEGVFAAPVGRGNVGEAVVGVLDERAVRGWAGQRQRQGQRVAVDVAVVAEQIEDQAAVFGQRRDVVAGDRGVVDGGDGEVDDTEGAEFAVARREGECVAAVPVGGWAIGPGAVRVGRHTAVAGLSDGDRQRIAVDVAGLGQQVEGEAAVFEQGGGKRADHRGVVHRGEGQDHVGDGGVERAVAHLAGEGVAAVPVGVGGVGEAAVGAHGEGAVPRAAEDAGGERGGIGVGRRGQQVAGERRVFLTGQRLTAQGRRVIHRGDVEFDLRGGAHRAIAELDTDGIAAAPVGHRGVGPAAVGVLGDAAVLRGGGEGDAEGVAIDVGGAGEEVDGDRGVFVEGDGACCDDRGVVHRGDGEGDGGEIGVGAGVGAAIDEAVAEGVFAGPVGGRGVAEVAVGGEVDGAVRRAGDEDGGGGAGDGVVGGDVEVDRGVFGGGGAVVTRLRAVFGPAEVEIFDGDAAAGGGGPLAEADEVESEVYDGAGGGVGVHAGEVDEDGAAAVGVADGGDAAGFCFGAVGLQVEEGVVVGEAGAGEERAAGVGVDEGDFEGVVGGVVDVVEGDGGEGEAESAVGLAEDEGLAEAGLGGRGFLEGGGAGGEGDGAGGGPGGGVGEVGVGQCRVGGGVELGQTCRVGWADARGALAGTAQGPCQAVAHR